MKALSAREIARRVLRRVDFAGLEDERRHHVAQPIGELAAPRHHRRHDPLVPRRPVRLEPVAVVVPGQLAQEREPLFGEAGESHQRGQLRSWLK